MKSIDVDSLELAELKRVYPALNAAATQLLGVFGPSFTGTPTGHIETDIAGAASLAGSVLLRSVVPDVERHAPGEIILADVHDGQDRLLQFMAGVAPGMGLSADAGWSAPVPREHDSLLEVPVLVGKLQTALEQASAQAGVEPQFRAHVAALAAMKLVGAGHAMGLLDERTGKSLAMYYLVAGSKTVPPQFEQLQG